MGSSNGEKSVCWFQKKAWESSFLPVELVVVRSSDALHNYFQVQIIEVKIFGPYVVPLYPILRLLCETAWKDS